MTTQISKYRNAIMGCAILWIMSYHSGISFPIHIPFLSPLASYIRSTGFGAVDIFMFLSGFGLYQTLSHNSSLTRFYKKRLLRTIPSYLPVLTVWLFLHLPEVPEEMRLSTVINNLTGAAFWLSKPPSFNWYMPAIIVFYLITPAFFRFMGKRWKEAFLLLLTVLLDICFLGNYVIVAVSRFTVFTLGMILGRYFKEDRQIKQHTEISAYLLGIASYTVMYYLREAVPLLMWPYGLHWYPFIFIAPAVTFLLCRILSLIDITAAGHKICELLDKVGQSTLEIYLIHIVLFDYLHIESSLLWILIFITIIFCAYFYHRLIIWITSPR